MKKNPISTLSTETIPQKIQRAPLPILNSTIKLRQAGFGDCVDTEVMFRRHLTRMIERGVLPKP